MSDRLRSWLLWTWGLLLFGGLAGVLLFWITFFKPQRYDPWMKKACWWFLRALGIHLRVIDRGGRRTGGAYLFVANHVNVCDPFVFQAAISHPFRAVELRSHFHWPLYGWVIRRLGNIPIERERPRRALASLAAAARALQKGTSLIMFPEGSRTRDGKLLPFKRGPFHLAQTAGVDIVPVVQIGSFAINNKVTGRLRPGEVKVVILAPIRYLEIAPMDSRELRDMVREQMREAME
jgi:1-acyl-sn-glycerol-3-phosphate acyltransferase